MSLRATGAFLLLSFTGASLSPATALAAETAPAPSPVAVSAETPDAGAPPTDAASTSSTTPGSPATESAAGARTADELIRAAAAAYDQGRFDDAVVSLEHAYRLDPRPAILFNLAQVQRTWGDCAVALSAYRRFLAAVTSNDPNRARAIRFEAEMQTCVNEHNAAATVPAKSLAPVPGGAPVPGETVPPLRPQAATVALNTQPPPAPVTQPPISLSASAPQAKLLPPTPARIERIAGWSLLGVGALATVGGAIYTGLALHKRSEIDNQLSMGLPVRYDENRVQMEQDRVKYVDHALWLGATAVAAASGGGFLLWLSSRATRPEGHEASNTLILGYAGRF